MIFIASETSISIQNMTKLKEPKGKIFFSGYIQ